jgi:hypothetical protein
MPYAIQFSPVSRMTSDQYDQVIKQLDEAGEAAPQGRIHHLCYGTPDNLRVVDVWESMAAFERFGTTLVPLLTGLGVDLGRPDVEEVHNIVRG